MFAEQSMPDRQPSPGLSPSLSSNNPFRRAVSPGLQSPASLQDRSSSGSRPMSRNPFLSTFEAEFNKEAKKTDNLIDMEAKMTASPKKATFGTATEDLFKNLTIEDDQKRSAPPRPAPNRSATDQRQHRPSRSEEERERMRADTRGNPRARGPPGSSRPPPRAGSRERRERRPRRNSESSIIDKGSLDPDEERRRRQRRRERDERAKDGKSSTTKKVRRPQGLDLIDKLDVTGIYGPSMIHHDGPYDAVQPHRNRKKDARAPMEAFPVGSANNSLGGSGPLNSKIDLDRIHGRGAEGFTDFGNHEVEFKKPRVEAEFSVKGRSDIIHGEPTHGLGTSTFLEGAPASRKAVQEDMEAQRQAEASGLGRKKSIAQRFRGISQPRRAYVGEGRITSPEARFGTATSPNGPYSAGALSQSKATEANPFFDEYNQAYDSKGASIKATEGSGQSPPGRNALQRSVTADSVGSPTNPANTTNESKASNGFLNRVKSLKGGRRRPA